MTGTIEQRITQLNDNIELLIATLKGNPMNPNDGGIVGDIADIKGDYKHMDERLRNVELFQQKIIWTYLIIVVIVGFSGTVLGLYLAWIKK
ncbi:MAG TPA: hypothetical protein PL045_00680 [Chitinophagaceae bacterium]|nr:hypothetical protein [Chitinophagaceae bacterium]